MHWFLTHEENPYVGSKAVCLQQHQSNSEGGLHSHLKKPEALWQSKGCFSVNMHMFFDNSMIKLVFLAFARLLLGCVCALRSIFGSADLGVFSAPHRPPLKCLSSGRGMDLRAEEKDRQPFFGDSRVGGMKHSTVKYTRLFCFRLHT